jgi:hypothetical protein
MDGLLVTTGEQEEGERYRGERNGDQRSEGGAKPVGCLRHHDLRLSALIGPTPAPDRGSCECGMRRYPSTSCEPPGLLPLLVPGETG